MNNDGGFFIGKKAKKGQKAVRGGLDKHKHLVLRVVAPEDYTPVVAARAAKEKEDLANDAFPLNSNGGKGPIVGPGIPNNGDFFAVIDGEHRLAVFPKKYAGIPFL